MGQAGAGQRLLGLLLRGDLVSNQLGVQWFRQHGRFVNGGANDGEVRSRFISRIEQFFSDIQIVDDPKVIKKKAASLPPRERWTAQKKTLAQIKARFPELFLFTPDFRLRIAVYDTQALAEQHQKEVVAALPSRAPATNIEPFLPKRFALYMQPLAQFDAVVWKSAVDKAVNTGSGGALVERIPGK